MSPKQSRSHQSSQRLRSIEIWCMAKVNTSLIRTNYSHRSIPSTTTISIERTHVLVISVRASAGTLIEATAYTALDEHDHINAGEKLLHVYVSAWRPT